MEGEKYEVAVRDEVGVDAGRLVAAVRAGLAEGGADRAVVSLSAVGDGEMRALNRRWLGHDYTTDVLSFLLEPGGGGEPLEGEIVVNPAYAGREAAGHSWPPHALPAAARELMLYAAHGALHLCGHDDRTPTDRRAMRRAEAAALARLGVTVPGGHGDG